MITIFFTKDCAESMKQCGFADPKPAPDTIFFAKVDRVVDDGASIEMIKDDVGFHATRHHVISWEGRQSADPEHLEIYPDEQEAMFGTARGGF